MRNDGPTITEWTLNETTTVADAYLIQSTAKQFVDNDDWDCTATAATPEQWDNGDTATQ